MAICDDEEVYVESLAKELERYSREQNKEIKIVKFTKALHFLDQTRDNYD